MAKKTQWHPVFAELLRPAVESHYEVATNVPVSDVPREADFVLLRRTRAGPLPFTGLWRHLTGWNVLEFKGPTVKPRAGDLHLLIEVGLGIFRRKNEERAKQGEALLAPEEVSFWYLARRLGPRLRRVWGRRGGGLSELGPGVWRCAVLGHLVFLLSGAELPVEEDSLPLHIVGPEAQKIDEAMARLVTERPALWERYRGWLATLHPDAYEEILSMDKTKRRRTEPSLDYLIRTLGLDWLIRQAGAKHIIEHMGAKRVISELGVKRFIAEGGLDALLASLTPAQRRELKERLE